MTDLWWWRRQQYRFYDAEGRLVYVGIAVDPEVRSRQHKSSSSWWPSVASWTREWHPDRFRARAAELAAMLNEDPLHNHEGRETPAQRLPTVTGSAWAGTAIEMRRRGMTYREIARTLGVHRDRVKGVVYHAFMTRESRRARMSMTMWRLSCLMAGHRPEVLTAAIDDLLGPEAT